MSHCEGQCEDGFALAGVRDVLCRGANWLWEQYRTFWVFGGQCGDA
jgi:hypothetical protein